MEQSYARTLTIDEDFYSRQDAEWIFGLILEYLEGVDIKPSSMGFRIEVDYNEEDIQELL